MTIRFVKSGGFYTPRDSQLQQLMHRVRDHIVTYIRDYTRTRVRDFSEGAGGTPLEGYSTNPLVVDYPGGLKNKRKPTGGTKVHDGMFFYGGYKQYRERAGLESNRFQFLNTGDAWRDWKVLRFGEGTTPSEIGFSDPLNAMAAAAAQEKRPLLFSIDSKELSVVDATVVDLINGVFFPS